MSTIGRTKNVLLIIILIFAASICIYSQTYRSNSNKKSDKDSSYGRTGNITAAVALSGDEIERSGIQTEKVKAVVHTAESIAYGSVVSIRDLSNDFKNYETGKAQLAKAKEELSISKAEYERKKQLYEKQLASEQEFQSAKAAYSSDEADISSAAANINSLKNSLIEEWGDRLANWIFNDSKELQKLLSFKNKLIQISLPPDENDIIIPDKIYIITSSDTKRITCRFESAGHLANSQFQTKSLYYTTTSLGGKQLMSGSNVKAYLPTGKKSTGIIIPSESIILYQGSSWIYVKISSGKFQRVKINTGSPSHGGFFISPKDELKPGSEIVTQGAQLLLSEELKSQTKNAGGEAKDND